MNSYFFVVMLLTTLILFLTALLTAERIARKHYEQKSDFYAQHPVKPGDIVFLGDSITDGACWDELFPDLPVKHRGINGDTTSGVLRRMGAILSGQPAAIFILIGTNDLPWFMVHNPAYILKTYEGILKRCAEESPLTQVFVQSILPRHWRYARSIKRLNYRLCELAGRYGYTYINLFPQFANSKGGLRADLTNDRLHLLAKGYALWVEILDPHIATLKSSLLEQSTAVRN